MSTTTLPLDLQAFATQEKRGKCTVCIVGCGSVGVSHTVLFSEAGFKVICYDSDQTVVNNVARGKVPFSNPEYERRLKAVVKSGRFSATNDVKKAVSQSEIIALAISARVDSKKKTDYSQIEGMCKKIGSNLRIGSLILVLRLVGTGVMEGLVKEPLENSSGFKTGTDFFLAFSPVSPLTSENGMRIVAAFDKKSLEVASAALESTKQHELRKTLNMKAAELAALFQVQSRDIQVSVSNELAVFCEKARADYLEIRQLMAGNTNNISGPQLSWNSQEEPYLLLGDADNLNIKLWIPSTARQINEHISRHVSNLVKDALKSCGKTFRRARITILGISQTSDSKTLPRSNLTEITQMLVAKGARVTIHDPHYTENEMAEAYPQFKKNLNEAAEGADCLIVLTGHDQFKGLSLNKLKLIMRKLPAIVDLEGVLEPSKVEKEGFTYRGFGRGVWTK